MSATSGPSALNLSFYPVYLGLQIKPYDNEGCEKYYALPAAEACFIFGTVIGTIETVFWGAIFLLAEAIHLFIPKSFETPTSICNWIYSMLDSSASITVGSALLMACNFCKTAKECEEG